MILKLKPGKELSVLRRHPWIFSGAIDQMSAAENGSICTVVDANGAFLAKAMVHQKNSIAARIVSFTDEPIHEVLENRLLEALALRRRYFSHSATSAYRLINAEGDGFPGLVVDVYGDVLVVQISTCGMQLLKEELVSLLKKHLSPSAIYEKSLSSARTEEGLAPFEGWIFGTAKKVQVVEENLVWNVEFEHAQKTGLFLDQREMRRFIETRSQGLSILNCFSYSGGFSLYALRGGAKRVVSVDVSSQAHAQLMKNLQLNPQLPAERHEAICEEVFSYLQRCQESFDLIILDPPAFAKQRKDVDAACRGYKELVRLALARLAPKSALLVSCCSYFIEESLLQNLLFQVSSEEKRQVKILMRHRQAFDHPVSIYHPEGSYLKSFFLYVH